MTAVRWKLALALSALLAAATAAADVVVIDKETIKCQVVSCDTNFTRLKLPSGGIRMLRTCDVSEIRLSDSSRVAELAAQLPQVRVTPDSIQPLPPPAARALQMKVTRDSVWCAGPLHAASQSATPVEMAAKCRELYGVLLECGQSNDTIVELLHDVEREEQALRRIWPSAVALCVPGILGGVLCGILGAAIYAPAWAASQTSSWDVGLLGACMVGCGVGGAVGSTLGPILGASARRHTIIAHRERVNTLVRRVNRAVATTP